MNITLWRGTHSKELQGFVARAWRRNELLILCPPGLSSFDFLKFFPEESVFSNLILAGEWDAAATAAFEKSRASIRDFSRAQFPTGAVYGVFTSGTTSGAPRLVLYSKSNVEFSLNAIRSLFDTSELTGIFSYPQPTHTCGVTLGYVHAFLHGIELHTGTGKYSRRHHSEWMDCVDSGMLTLGTPVHFHDLVVACGEASFFPPNSYSCIVGGAKTTVALWKSLRDRLNIRKPSIGYGATEASPGLAQLAPGLPPEQDGDIGSFLPGIKTNIIPGTGIEFEGPNACLALIRENKIQFPQRILIRDELNRSVGGRLIFQGRTELTLNRGGIKIPLEIAEDVLSQELGVSAICVITPDARLGEELGVVARSSPDDSEKIFDVLKEKFSQNFDRRNIVFVENLPSTANSKFDRLAASRLLEHYLQNSGDQRV
ncbi:MAG: class I adenylate-forming enzyme family protein [Bdellovibrionia bacterium]